MLTRSDKAIAVDKVRNFMRKHGLCLDDLTEYGGEDFKNPRRAEKAHRVDKCWSLMAQLGLVYTDLEPIPD